MKSILIAFVFAIGFMVSLPTSGYSKAPPGQVCFVADHQFCDIAATAIPSQLTFKVYQFAGIGKMVVEKGGGVDVQVMKLVTQPTNLTEQKMNSTDFTHFYNYDFRLCRYSKQPESQIITQNIESRTRCTIRADSQV